MMRPARRAMLIAFYLLTSAAPAYAECAWVLWTEHSEKVGGRVWHAEAAFPKVDSCEREKKIKVRVLAAAGGLMHEDLVTFPSHPDRYWTAYYCLPDTVDPRGGKESGR